MDDEELERIKQRKLAEMKRRLEQEENQKREEEDYARLVGAKRKKLLGEVLEPSAAAYLEKIRSANPALAKQIEDTVILLLYRGQIITKVDELAIKLLERRIERKDPTITIARRGEDSLTLGKDK